MKTRSLVLAALLVGALALAALPGAHAASWCTQARDPSCDGLACYYGTEPDVCVDLDDVPIPCRDWYCPDPIFP